MVEDSSTFEGGAKRPIRKREFAFLRRELDFWRSSDLISEQQLRDLGDLYEPSKGHMSQVLVGLGAMLVGLGFLSYIAANWMDFSRMFRVGLILGVYALAMFSSWRLEPSFPGTSRALLLLAGFVYGGGIFLIAQMFHEGGHYTTALFWWMVGVVPAALLFRDRLQLLLLQTIALVYVNGFYLPWYTFFGGYGYAPVQNLASFVWSILRNPEPLLVVLGLWGIWRLVDNRWSFGFRVNTFILLNFVVIHAFRFFNDFAMALVFCVLVGILLGVCSFGYWKWDLGGWGIVLTGIAGIFLTLPEIWNHSRIVREGMLGFLSSHSLLWSSPGVALSVGMAIFVCVALLWSIHRGFTVAIPLFCLLILRYYFDRFYDFMPKALFFTVGGLILIGMGFWLERVRKRQRGRKQENGEVRS